MKTPQVFKLIDGTFSATDARSILTSIISAKINFHSLKQFSEQIRYGNDKYQTEQRITELKKLNENLIQLIDEVTKKGLRLKIKSNIEIELEEDLN